MFWNRYLLPSFVVLAIVGFFNWLGQVNYYYWTVPWYDAPIHFLGGAWVALFWLWALESKFFSGLKPLLSGRKVIFVVLAIGLLWEIYELVLGVTDVADKKFMADTIKDLVMDILGGTLAVYIMNKKEKR